MKSNDLKTGLALSAVLVALMLLTNWCNAATRPKQTASPSPSPTPTESAIPTNATCSDFATQAEAKKALPLNPGLDRDSDGIPCESLPPE
jgi:hypothetical protein